MKYMKCCHVPLDLDENKSVKVEFNEFDTEIREAGEEVRSLRQEKQWAVEELAQKLEIPSSYLEEIERGEQPIPRDLAKKFGQLFDVDPALFL